VASSPAIWIRFSPALLLVAYTCLRLLPYPFAGIAHFMPALDAACIFFWALRAPSALSLWFIALLGLFYDLLSGMPLGITSLLHISLYTATGWLRPILKKWTPSMIWGAWVFLSLGFVAAMLFLFSLHDRSWSGTWIYPSFFWLMTAMAFPLVYSLCQICYRAFPSGWFYAE
jgi:cell shape-determining protein MreD